MTPQEEFAAGLGGEYTVDSKTGLRTRVVRTAPPEVAVRPSPPELAPVQTSAPAAAAAAQPASQE